MNFPHVTTGQPWRPNAAKENAWTDAANDFAARRGLTIPGGKIDRKLWDAGAVWTKNVSASNYDRYSVVGLRDPIFTDPAQAAFSQFTGFEVSSPISSASPFAILQEPLPIGVARRAGVNVGVTPCQIYVNDEAHEFAIPVEGETGFLESSSEGPAEILWKAGNSGVVWSIVRLVGNSIDETPDIIEILTKVCPAKKPGPPTVIRPSESKMLDTVTPGDYLIDTTVNLPEGMLTFVVSVVWKDDENEAVSGDYFGFKLGIDSTLLDGAPNYYVMFGGISAEKTIEYTWTYRNPAAKPLPILLYVYRVSGTGGMTAHLDSKITVKTEAGSLINERRQLILPDGSHLGPKVCVVDPTDCCNDDQSSYTASDLLVVPCCSVPVPSQWKVTFSGVNFPKRGWQNYDYGIAANFDAFIDAANDALNATHILTYRGTAQGFSQAVINCVFESTILYTNPKAFVRVGLNDVEEVDLAPYFDSAPNKIVFKLREYVQPAEVFLNAQEPPYGYVSSPTIRAYAELLVDVAVRWDLYAQALSFDMHTRYEHHFTEHFHFNQEWGLSGPELANIQAIAGTWPSPMTNCDGQCNLWAPKDRVQIEYNQPARLENAYPLFVTVEPV